MKRIALVMLPALALLVSPAFGQTERSTTGKTEQIIATQSPDQSLSENIIGASVTTGTDEKAAEIGKIQSLVFDNDNRLVAALIGMGGFLGMGEKTVALSWDSLEKVDQDGQVRYVVNMSREELEKAPAFKTQEELKAAEARQQRLEQQETQRRMQNPAMPQGSQRAN